MKVAFREKLHIIEYIPEGKTHPADALDRYGTLFVKTACLKAPDGNGTLQGVVTVYISLGGKR